MTGSPETFQLSLDAAEAYEARFVPALFGEWAPHLVDAGGVRPGHRVLDVACGTGVVAREAADRQAGDGHVVGVDINDAMLTVAGRLRSDIEWRTGDAADLPFSDASFDVVLCQAALMFIPDPAAALREMGRVAGGDGNVAFQVWAGLDDQPGYGRLVEVAARHAGPEAVNLLGAYWVLGDLAELRRLCDKAGLTVDAVDTRLGTARFESVEQVVRIEVESTPLGDRIDDDTFDRILRDARVELARYETKTGVELPIAGHIVTARRA